MNITSISSANIPETVKSPADALAVLAAKKGMDIQRTVAAGLVQLLVPSVGQNLNVSA
jgi:hypothetical protein